MTLPAMTAGPELAQTGWSAHPVASLIITAGPDPRVVGANHSAQALLNRSSSALIDCDVCAAVGLDTALLWRIADDVDGDTRLYAVRLAPDGTAAFSADVVVGSAGGGNMRVIAIHPLPTGSRSGTPRTGAGARTASAAAAMLAHEIKNPLSGIRGAAQLMGRQLRLASGTARTDELSKLICQEVDRIAMLIDSMQGFTRDQLEVAPVLNIYPAIKQAHDIASVGVARGVTFVERFDPSLPPVRGNHDALVQILLNLIANAAQAMGDTPGTITLATAYRHGVAWNLDDGGRTSVPVEISVIDNGPGVPANLIDSVFEPFISGRKDGQGLGLALVDKLMRDMGGLVRHERRGGETYFILNLAMSEADEAAAATQPTGATDA